MEDLLHHVGNDMLQLGKIQRGEVIVHGFRTANRCDGAVWAEQQLGGPD